MPDHSPTDSGFLRGLRVLVDAEIEFILVGVAAINFYARDASRAFYTLDADALVAPNISNLRRALQALASAGFALEARGEPFLDLDDEEVLSRILQVGANLIARDDDGTHLDLMLSITGFSYPELEEDARPFEVAGATLWVGRLEKLLRSKELSGRPKDIQFLRQFMAQALDDE